MPGTLISVVYVRASGIATRIIDTTVDPDDSHVAIATQNLPGSLGIASIAKASLPLVNGQPDTRIETLITVIAAVGGPTINLPQQCAVVDAVGKVVDMYVGDPAPIRANAVRLHQLILSSGGQAVGPNAVTVQRGATGVGIGWSYANGVFTAPTSPTGATGATGTAV